MANLPIITDYLDVKEYLSEFNVDFQFLSVKEVPCPDEDSITFKYGVSFETHPGCKMRAYTYGTTRRLIKESRRSFWEIIHSIFHLARMAFVNSYQGFCIQMELEADTDSRRLYNRGKSLWKRFVNIGLTRIDIAEIINHAYNAQLRTGA